MHKTILVAALAALAACSGVYTAKETEAASVLAAFPINQTSWEYVQNGKLLQLSVDVGGNYIITSGTQHVDHGTAMIKNGKFCFTSAMTKEGENCWTNPKLNVDASGETVSDKGEKLQLKRVIYVPRAM